MNNQIGIMCVIFLTGYNFFFFNLKGAGGSQGPLGPPGPPGLPVSCPACPSSVCRSQLLWLLSSVCVSINRARSGRKVPKAPT